MLFLIGIITVIFDQVIKRLIITNFQWGESIPVVNNVLHITYVKNTGAAFGILKEYTALFSILSIMIVILLLYIRKKYITKEGFFVDIAFGLIIGGAVGNLIDRISLGFVIDYLDLRVWPVFNLADSAVVVGSFLLVFYLWNNELE